LSIDADEIVTAELRMEIEKALQQEQFNGYESLVFPVIAAGKSVMAAGWPGLCAQVFRRHSGRFSDSLVHEKIFVKAQ